jgi:hypothetical protein
LGTTDPELLLWAEQHIRVLISLDRKTMIGHIAAHLQAGHHTAGLFLLRRRWTIPQVIDEMTLADQLADPQDLVDQIEYIP